MPIVALHELVPMLQVATGPVILISGVGLLLLTLANRFGRAADRSRQLAREMRGLTGGEHERLARQVGVLYRRARLIRLAIVMAALCVFQVAVLIIVLFVAALLKWEAGLLISVIFMGCMASLIVALAAFIMEIQLSLRALKLELSSDLPD